MVYTTWNPYWCKQRLNVGKSVSLYSRLALQQRVHDSGMIEQMELNNDGTVICMPCGKIYEYLKTFKNYYPEETIFIAKGSSIRKRIQMQENALYDNNVQEKRLSFYETDDFGKLLSLDNHIIDKLYSIFKEDDYPDFESMIKIAEEYYPQKVSSKMTASDWIKLFRSTNWNGINKNKSILYVESPNGQKTCYQNSSKTFIEIIESNFPDLIAEIGITHAGVPLVSKTLNDKYSNYQRPIQNGWFVYTNISTKKKKTDLQKISDELGLDLKVSVINQNDSVDIIPSSTDKEHDMPSNRAKIRVKFPDGRVIQPNKVLEALVEVVRFAGPEKVRALNIIVCGDNIITKKPIPQYAKRCKPVGDGWFCNTCSNTPTKLEQIQTISSKLNLGIISKLI